MTDEPTRRMFPERDATQGLPNLANASETAIGYSAVPERPSSRPESFSERELPTLASPNSMAAPTPTPTPTDERMSALGDRIGQLEADLENVYAQLEQLADAAKTAQLRGRAARMGRYLLWGALIAALVTFWMMLRLRAGSS